MGRRARSRGRAERLRAPSSLHSHPEHGELELRGALSPASRGEYAAALAGEGRPAATAEDREARAAELLFERLAVRWTIAGVPTTGQRELLARLRLATSAERAWVRRALREHLAEHFPEMRAP